MRAKKPSTPKKKKKSLSGEEEKKMLKQMRTHFCEEKGQRRSLRLLAARWDLSGRNYASAGTAFFLISLIHPLTS